MRIPRSSAGRSAGCVVSRTVILHIALLQSVGPRMRRVLVEAVQTGKIKVVEQVLGHHEPGEVQYHERASVEAK